MSQTAVLVWLSASSVLPTFRADLDAFAHSRLLRLEAPRENAAPYRLAASAYAPDAVAQIESSLEEARTAAASLEQSRALGALERAERVLREHPELPQSAWLMAEIFEQAAEIENTAPDGAQAADALRKRAAALQGARAAPFSERASEGGAEPSDAHRVSVEGLEPSDVLEWDGVQAQGEVMTAAGDHHVRVARGSRLLWAGWLKLGPDERRVRLPVPETIACSADDVGRGYFAAGRAVAAAHTRCPSYVLARARPGGIEAALCERAQCGKVVIWEHPHGEPRAHDRLDEDDLAVRRSPPPLARSPSPASRSGAPECSTRGQPTSHETWVFSGQQQQMALRF